MELRVVEHLCRWTNWEDAQKSDYFTKTEPDNVEFRVKVNPAEEKAITYTVQDSR